MKTQKKDVFFTKVVVDGNVKFEEILLDEDLPKKQIDIKQKTVEFNLIDEYPKFIIGMIISTQSRNIPPTHKPGEKDDYSAVPLEEGKGFAYPNVFIFDKEHSVLLYEKNFFGVNESGIESYFNRLNEIWQNSPSKGKKDFRISLLPIIKTDYRGRIKNMWKIKSVELQVAKPLLIREANLAENGLLNSVVHLADSSKSDKGINVCLKNSTETLLNMAKNKVIQLYDEFTSIDHQYYGAYKDRLKITGITKSEDGSLIEDAIDVMLDRLIGRFYIQVEDVATSIYANERKKKIIEVYNASLSDMLRSV